MLFTWLMRLNSNVKLSNWSMFIIYELIYNQTYQAHYGFEMITILHNVHLEWHTRKTIVCMHGRETKLLYKLMQQ